MPGSHRPQRSATLLTAALLAVALAGCGSNSNDTSHTGTHGDGPHRPVTTSDADWKSVTDALGRTGKFGDSNTAYRIPLVRNDLQVVTAGVPIKPASRSWCEPIRRLVSSWLHVCAIPSDSQP